MTGWDLIAAAQERIGQFWTLTQSQVYRELTAMADGPGRGRPPGARDRKPYEVTPARPRGLRRVARASPARTRCASRCC